MQEAMKQRGETSIREDVERRAPRPPRVYDTADGLQGQGGEAT
jgi:hypothetical protein